MLASLIALTAQALTSRRISEGVNSGSGVDRLAIAVHPPGNLAQLHVEVRCSLIFAQARTLEHVSLDCGTTRGDVDVNARSLVTGLSVLVVDTLSDHRTRGDVVDGCGAADGERRMRTQIDRGHGC